MWIEVREWGLEDNFGDREYLGVHFYDVQTATRVVRRGGALETHLGAWLTTTDDVESAFGD